MLRRRCLGTDGLGCDSEAEKHEWSPVVPTSDAAPYDQLSPEKVEAAVDLVAVLEDEADPP